MFKLISKPCFMISNFKVLHIPCANLRGMVRQQKPDSVGPIDPISLSSHSQSTSPVETINAISSQENSYSVDLSQEPFIPKSLTEFKKLKNRDIKQPSLDRAKTLYVSIVGEPNAGKSTLLNRLVRHEISSVSSRVHTTRKNVLGVACQNDTQLVFYDTPGIVTRDHVFRHSLGPSFVNDVRDSIYNTDIIAVLVDVANKHRRARINPGILEYLRNRPDKKSILILNKIDKIKAKRKLLEIGTQLSSGYINGYPTPMTTSGKTRMNLLSESEMEDEMHRLAFDAQEVGWPYFSRLFMVSAVESDGLEQLERYFYDVAVPNRPWRFPGEMITDQNPEEIVTEMVRSKLLGLLEAEIPYKCLVRITEWEVDELGNLMLSVTVKAPERVIPPIIGTAGQRVKIISKETKESLQQLFRCNVRFKLIVNGVKPRTLVK